MSEFGNLPPGQIRSPNDLLRQSPGRFRWWEAGGNNATAENIFNEVGGIDPNTGGISGPLGMFGPRSAPVWQQAHNLAVWNAQRRLERQATGYQEAGLRTMSSFRPGGASAYAAGLYGNLSNIALQRSAMLQPLDLMFNWRQDQDYENRRRARATYIDQRLHQVGASLLSMYGGGGGGGGGQPLQPIQSDTKTIEGQGPQPNNTPAPVGGAPAQQPAAGGGSPASVTVQGGGGQSGGGGPAGAGAAPALPQSYGQMFDQALGGSPAPGSLGGSAAGPGSTGPGQQERQQGPGGAGAGGMGAGRVGSGGTFSPQEFAAAASQHPTGDVMQNGVMNGLADDLEQVDFRIIDGIIQKQVQARSNYGTEGIPWGWGLDREAFSNQLQRTPR